MNKELYYNTRLDNYYVTQQDLICDLSGEPITESGLFKVTYTRGGNYIHFFKSETIPKHIRKFCQNLVLEGLMRAPVHEQISFFLVVDVVPKNSFPVFDLNPHLRDVRSFEGAGLPSVLAAERKEPQGVLIVNKTRWAGRIPLFNALESGEGRLLLGSPDMDSIVAMDQRMSIGNAEKILLTSLHSAPLVDSELPLQIPTSNKGVNE